MRWGWVLVVLAGCGPGGSADAGADAGSDEAPASCESVTVERERFSSVYEDDTDAAVASIRVWAEASIPDEWGFHWTVFNGVGDIYDADTSSDGVRHWATIDLGENFRGPYSAGVRYDGSADSPDTLTVDCVAFEVVE